MAEDITTLVIRVRSDEVNTARKRLDELGYRAGTAENATDGLTTAFKRLVTAAAAIGVLRQVTGLIGDYEQTMSGVAAVTGATTDQMIELKETARDLGATTRFSAREAAEGMRLLGQAGFKTNQIIEAMPGLLDLAVAGELSIKDATDITAASLAGFRLQASDSARAADVLAAAATNSNTNVFQLGDAIKYVAPIAAGMGITIEDTAAAIGVLSNAGLQGSMAGTGLRQVLSSLATPTKEAADTLRAYGIAAQDVNPATHSLTEILETLAKAGLTTTDALVIAGDRGGNALSTLVQSTDSLVKLNGVMDQAGGAAKRMAGIMGDNWRGDLLQLRSAVEELGLKMGDAGLSKYMRDATQSATDFVRAINDMVVSGEASAWLDLIQFKLLSLSDGFDNTVEGISASWEWLVGYVTGTGSEMAGNITDAFINLPENVRAVTEGIGATFGLLWVEIANGGRASMDIVVAGFTYLQDTVTNVLREIHDQVTNPFSEGQFNYVEEQAKAYENLSTTVKGAWKTVEDGHEAAKEAWMEEVTAIMNDRDASIESANAKIERIKQLREEYQKTKKAREESEGKDTAPVGRVNPEAPATTKFDIQGFTALRQQLQLEEKTVQESYDRRLELIRLNTQEGSELRLELERSLNESLAVEMADAQDAAIERMSRQHEVEQAELDRAFSQRLISESEYQRKSQEAWKKYTNGVVAVGTKGTAAVSTKQLEMWSSTLSMAGEMAGLMTQLVGENNSAAKAMFAISKALAIAEILVNTHVGAAKAVGMMGPFGIPLAEIIMAQGYASAALTAAIAIQQFEHGGMIPAGQVGLVGETGVPELVKGPAVVTSARTTSDLMGRGKSSTGTTTINVNNYVGDAEVDVRERETEQGKVVDISVRRSKREIATGIMTGGSEVSKALESTYGLRRNAS